MTAQSNDRQINRRSGSQRSRPVKANAAIYQGGLVAMLAGVAIAARAATTRAELDAMRIDGIAEAGVTGGASDGLVKVPTTDGVFLFANSASTDAITLADIGNPAFAVDDQTVAKTVGGGARPIAGKIIDVETLGVWVEVGKAEGPRRIRLQFAINETDTLAPTTAEVVSPVAGAISSMSVIVQKAVTTGGDVTAKVGTTDVVGLACTIADAATKGTVVTDTPTLGDATTVVAAGDRIQIVPGAAFNTAGAVSGFVEITY